MATPTTGLDSNADTPTEQPRVLLRVEEAAERLAISRTLMFAHLKNRLIESVKVGRLRRIPVDALTAYVSSLSPAGRTHDQAA